MAIETLQDVFEHQIQDLYSAENQLIEALPDIINATTSEDLKRIFERHLTETRTQKERITVMGERLGIAIEGETCHAMAGLIEESTHIIKDNKPSDALDAALIAAAQRIEHYEIAAYGSTVAYAKRLGYDTACETLQATLNEEYDADNELGELARGDINQQAMQAV
jgi:ferritin-like metal-binding protein YciE